jgi:sucrose phosphorylase
MRNQVQLIAYADRLGGTLRGLDELLHGPLGGLFGGVHLLPFFDPYDGADAGFDPADHRQVDPRLGTWADIARLSGSFEVAADLIVNHMSTDAAPFLDFREQGDASRWAGMFLTFDRVFADGATEDQILRIYRPRPGLPFTPLVSKGAGRRLLWTTFTSRQVDLDVHDPETERYLVDILGLLADNGVAIVRLDAVGYAVKTAGTSCFMTEATLDYVEELRGRANKLGIEVLAELHSHYDQQIRMSKVVDRVYDFALPPLVLHALFTGDGQPLRRWLDLRPKNAITVLDTHDGIGLIDVSTDQTVGELTPLLSSKQVRELAMQVHENSEGTSVLATGQTTDELDIYQIDCSFYDALGRDPGRYLLARLLQFFVPGVPQVYYVGLLAGRNDPRLRARTGDGRELNRRRYTGDELTAALEQPVVQDLLRLIRFRNEHPAFQGAFSCLDAPDGGLVLRWRNGSHETRLSPDLAAGTYTLSYTDPAGGMERLVTAAADLRG